MPWILCLYADRWYKEYICIRVFLTDLKRTLNPNYSFGKIIQNSLKKLRVHLLTACIKQFELLNWKLIVTVVVLSESAQKVGVVAQQVKPPLSYWIPRSESSLCFWCSFLLKHLGGSRWWPSYLGDPDRAPGFVWPSTCWHFGSEPVNGKSQISAF